MQLPTKSKFQKINFQFPSPTYILPSQREGEDFGGVLLISSLYWGISSYILPFPLNFLPFLEGIPTPISSPFLRGRNTRRGLNWGRKFLSPTLVLPLPKGKGEDWGRISSVSPLEKGEDYLPQILPLPLGGGGLQEGVGFPASRFTLHASIWNLSFGFLFCTSWKVKRVYHFFSLPAAQMAIAKASAASSGFIDCFNLRTLFTLF